MRRNVQPAPRVRPGRFAAARLRVARSLRNALNSVGLRFALACSLRSGQARTSRPSAAYCVGPSARPSDGQPAGHQLRPPTNITDAPPTPPSTGFPLDSLPETTPKLGASGTPKGKPLRAEDRRGECRPPTVPGGPGNMAGHRQGPFVPGQSRTARRRIPDSCPAPRPPSPTRSSWRGRGGPLSSWRIGMRKVRARENPGPGGEPTLRRATSSVQVT
jgi:hypothetical protein